MQLGFYCICLNWPALLIKEEQIHLMNHQVLLPTSHLSGQPLQKPKQPQLDQVVQVAEVVTV